MVQSNSNREQNNYEIDGFVYPETWNLEMKRAFYYNFQKLKLEKEFDKIIEEVNSGNIIF